MNIEYRKLHMPIWPKHTAAQRVAENLCANVDPKDVDSLIKDVSERRDKVGAVCETTIIAFIAIQLYTAGYVWLGLTNFKALGMELGESSTSCFIAYVIYNMLWIVRTGAFFKVLVLDAMFEQLVKKCSRPSLTQALDAHLSQFLFSSAVGSTLGTGDKSRSFRLLRNYSRNGIPLIYSLYFYTTLVWFIFGLLFSGPKGLSGFFMATLLIILTSISTALSLKTVIIPRADRDT